MNQILSWLPLASADTETDQDLTEAEEDEEEEDEQSDEQGSEAEEEDRSEDGSEAEEEEGEEEEDEEQEEDEVPRSSAQRPQPVQLTGDYTKIIIQPENIKDYVGPTPFNNDRIYKTTPPGVVMGLAWSPHGGSSLYIEAAAVGKGEGKANLKTTGQHALSLLSSAEGIGRQLIVVPALPMTSALRN